MESCLNSNKDDHLYRIIKFHHVVEILKGQLHFSNPSVWDDPYEARVRHPEQHAMFAQCWSRKSMSDAMWRIYSPDHLGVRIRTTRTKLKKTIKSFAKSNENLKFRVADVEYKKTSTVVERTEAVVEALRTAFDISKFADLLFVKRSAFSHEEEVRAVMYCPNPTNTFKNTSIKIPVNGFDLIESIFLDPRAPQELIEALKFYLSEKMDFPINRIYKSSLYTLDNAFEIE